ncbi:MAG TPA: response regulator transcription factor [Stenomitos sp.]
MKKPKLLVASADLTLQRLIAYLAGKVGPMDLLLSTSGADALRRAEMALPDAVILDAALPGMDGLSLTRRLRSLASFLDTPIFLLVDRADSKYQAFQVGATDVMVKPVDQLEFQYRLKVHLRARLRTLESTEVVEAGPLKLEPASQTAQVHGQSVALTPSEFAILSYLAARPKQSVSTENLLVEALGEPRQLGNPQVIHTHIKNLRRKLEPEPTHPTLILSSRRGYSFHTPD